jgi:hypothetical protein
MRALHGKASYTLEHIGEALSEGELPPLSNMKLLAAIADDLLALYGVALTYKQKQLESHDA